MSTFKIDVASLRLLGDANWLSINLFFDLAGQHSAQFMLDQPTPVAQQRSSRYINHLYDKYIRTYLQSYNGKLEETSVRQVVQAEDCPKNIKSVGWQSRHDWRDICLIPDPYYFMERGYEDFLQSDADIPSWSTRKSVIFWRGSTTGVIEGADIYANGFGADTLERLPRYRMCRLLQTTDVSSDVGIVAIVQCSDIDIRFVADRLAAEQLLAEYIPPRGIAQYKFLIDMDGNANSWNVLQRLRLGCCIIKVESSWIQWISHRIEPWVHYVPVKADLSDLLEKVDWCRMHDRQAEQIAENGRRFALSVRYEAEMRQAALDILRTSTPVDSRAIDYAVLEQVCSSADRLGPTWNAAIDAWSSFPEPMRLRTVHGTILGSDNDGRMVQLLSGSDLANAITLSGQEADWSEKLMGFHVDRDGNTLSLERGGLFLSAEPGNAVMACDRLEKGEWETFTLIPAC